VKKHTEHTALPISCSLSVNANVVSIGHPYQSSRNPLSELIHPRLFVQDIAEKLFPIVPSLDDYVCAICTNLAFKPIRLSCTHLFCARCLVKMQRKGEGSCPMCRAPSVLEANASGFLCPLRCPTCLANVCHELTFRECRLGIAEFYGGLVSTRG